MTPASAQRPLRIRIEGTSRPRSAPGHRLVARLGLTDGKGGPRCASVRPPAITWTAEPQRS